MLSLLSNNIQTTSRHQQLSCYCLQHTSFAILIRKMSFVYIGCLVLINRSFKGQGVDRNLIHVFSNMICRCNYGAIRQVSAIPSVSTSSCNINGNDRVKKINASCASKACIIMPDPDYIRLTLIAKHSCWQPRGAGPQIAVLLSSCLFLQSQTYTSNVPAACKFMLDDGVWSHKVQGVFQPHTSSPGAWCWSPAASAWELGGMQVACKLQ